MILNELVYYNNPVYECAAVYLPVYTRYLEVVVHIILLCTRTILAPNHVRVFYRLDFVWLFVS